MYRKNFNSIEEVINDIYNSLRESGINYVTDSGEMDIDALFEVIQSPLPTTYPSNIQIEIIHDDEIRVYVNEVLI